MKILILVIILESMQACVKIFAFDYNKLDILGYNRQQVSKEILVQNLISILLQ